MLQHLVFPFFIIYQVVSYGKLKSKENFKRLALKLEWSLSLSRGRRLQEVPNVVICLANFWHVGKLVAEERGLLTRGDFLHEHHTFTPPIEACKFR